jgi:hypothetical protein
MKLHAGRFHILFAKGWFDIPNEKYWDCLKLIASKYSGTSVEAITEQNIYNQLETILSKFKNIPFQEYNRELMQNITINQITGRNTTFLQNMIFTNISFISRLSNDEIGGKGVLGESEESINEEIQQLISEIK